MLVGVTSARARSVCKPEAPFQYRTRKRSWGSVERWFRWHCRSFRSLALTLKVAHSTLTAKATNTYNTASSAETLLHRDYLSSKNIFLTMEQFTENWKTDSSAGPIPAHIYTPSSPPGNARPIGTKVYVSKDRSTDVQ